MTSFDVEMEVLPDRVARYKTALQQGLERKKREEEEEEREIQEIIENQIATLPMWLDMAFTKACSRGLTAVYVQTPRVDTLMLGTFRDHNNENEVRANNVP